MDNTNDNNTINPSEKTQLDPCTCRRKGAKLEVYDWLSDIPESHDDTDLVEVHRAFGLDTDEKEQCKD